MRTIQQVLVATAFVFSMGTAMAETDKVDAVVEGFHALSQVTSSGDQAMMALTDEQLDNISGGWTPHPDGPIVIVKKWPFPWPWPSPCLSCPYPYMDTVGDIVINPLNVPSGVMTPQVTMRY